MGGYVIVDFAPLGTVEGAMSTSGIVLTYKGIGARIRAAAESGKPVLVQNLRFNIGGTLDIQAGYATTTTVGDVTALTLMFFGSVMILQSMSDDQVMLVTHAIS